MLPLLSGDCLTGHLRRSQCKIRLVLPALRQ